MFYNLQTIWPLVLLSAGLIIFAAVFWRWPRQGGALVLFLAPLYLLKINSLPLTALEALMWLFVLVWLAAKIKNRQGDWLRETLSGYSRGFWWALGFLLAGTFLAAVFSLDWRVSFGVVKAYFVAPLIFSLVLAEVFKKGSLKDIFLALFASGVAVAAVSLGYLVLGHLTYDGRLAAWYLSPNHLAMWLAPGLLAGLSLLFEIKKSFLRFFLFAIGYSLLAVSIFFTYSYGAWFGLAAAAVFVLPCLWQLNLLEKKWLFAIGCSMLAVVAVVVFLQLNSDDASKLKDLLVSPRSSWQSRLMIWQSAAAILGDNWLLGVGPGMFQSYYLAYQQYFPPYLEWAAPQPHSLFLAWWLQSGLLGLVGFVWLLIEFFRRVLKRLNKIPSWPAILLVAMMVYILAHGLVDTTFWKNDLALLFWAAIFSFRDVFWRDNVA